MINNARTIPADDLDVQTSTSAYEHVRKSMAEMSFEQLWADLVPVPQVDAPDAVVKIAYSKEYTNLMDLFRAVQKKEEYSERVLELIEELLELNAGNYTVWLYRRNCLKKLKLDLNEELDYLDGFSKENPKNYQIWHHRRTIVEWLGNGDRELAFCESVFEVDAKNYHAWAHRQWALQTYNLWDKELGFIEACLKTDIRNNSAWNQRWFYVHSGPETQSIEVLNREVAYCVESLAQVTLNESAWNYLRGLFKAHHQELHVLIRTRVEEMVESSSRKNPFALGLLADICEYTGNQLLTSATDAAKAVQELREASKICVELVSLDQIRAKSWTRRVRALSLRADSVVEAA